MEKLWQSTDTAGCIKVPTTAQVNSCTAKVLINLLSTVKVD
jgi:hypothetical protein